MRLAFIIFIIHIASNVFAGGDVGNGGDTVYCVASPSNPYRGYYSLDYIVNKINGMQFSNDFEKIVGPNDRPDKNLLRIMESAKKYPVLVQELKEFRENLYSNKYNLRYVWKKAPYGVVEIKDEKLRLQIPKNCLSKENNLIQTFYRVEKPWDMVWRGLNNRQYSVSTWGADFYFANEVLSQMNSLQLSFLYFHEWLWNLTQDPEMIRDLNAVFHSSGWDNDGADNMMEILKKFKWTIHAPTPHIFLKE